jgi:N-acetylneuraminic acid mutarotase
MNRTHAATFLAFPGLLLAQNDFHFDKVTPGTLGTTLNLAVRNAGANQPLLGMVSGTTGPTPVALLDPIDPRSVAVGIDLLGNWSLQLTDALGAATLATAIPSGASFQGFVFHWQCATFPGTTTFLDDISNSLSTMHAMAGTSATLPNGLMTTRAAATVCRTPTRNAGLGDFLLVSGATTEFFGFRDFAPAAGPTMVTPRALHAAATLNDGRVLFTGGVDGLGAVTTACEVYDPIANTFTAVAPLPGLRAGHAAATLPDGRVMVVGGTTNFTDLTTAITAALNTTEIWNPATNAWTAGPAIGGRRIVPSLSRLGNGRMLVAGGIEVTLLFGIPIALTSTNKAQLYNPATNAWTNAANMPIGRAYHQDNQVTLADGRVLLSGGVLVPDLLNAANAASIANADAYNSPTNTWTATTMSHARTGHAAVRLANGDVIVTGGAEGLVSAAVPLAAIARFVPATNTWADFGAMTTARVGHASVLLPDGMLVLVGGAGTTNEAMHF